MDICGDAHLEASIVCVQPLDELLRSSFGRCSLSAYVVPLLLRVLQCLLHLFQLALGSAELILQIHKQAFTKHSRACKEGAS